MEFCPKCLLQDSQLGTIIKHNNKLACVNCASKYDSNAILISFEAAYIHAEDRDLKHILYQLREMLQ